MHTRGNSFCLTIIKFRLKPNDDDGKKEKKKAVLGQEDQVVTRKKETETKDSASEKERRTEIEVRDWLETERMAKSIYYSPYPSGQ